MDYKLDEFLRCDIVVFNSYRRMSLFPGVCVYMLSHVQLFVTPWTAAHQAPLSMEFTGKNTVAGCHFLLQGIFLTQGSNLSSPALAGGFFTTSAPWEALSGDTC